MKKLFLTFLLSGMSSFVCAEEAVTSTQEGEAKVESTVASTKVEPIANIGNPESEEGEEDDILDEEQNDPLEPLNRSIYFVNTLVDAVVIKPLAIAYRLVLPEEVRLGIGNALTNLGAPITFLNHLLQGQPSRAGTTLIRFGLNTTLGIGGLFDPAKEMGFHTLETNFNETLGVWGASTGPYIVLPVIGPSSLRGAVGLGVGYYTQPLNYISRPQNDNQWIAYTAMGVELVHQRNLVLEALDDLEATSLDMYASLRSIYFQKQAYRLKKLQEDDDSTSGNEMLESSTDKEIFG